VQVWSDTLACEIRSGKGPWLVCSRNVDSVLTFVQQKVAGGDTLEFRRAFRVREVFWREG